MGFCIYNNVAAAAAAARAAGCRKLAIIDWDVHHGNGTQDIFWRDPDVLYASLHEWPLYPGSGAAAETGDGAGQGATINVPLPRGSGDHRYLTVLAEIIVPRLSAFAPELVLISAGYDAARGDRLAGMALSEAGYADMVRLLREGSRPSAGDRLIAVLEGGYDLGNLERCVAATAGALKATQP
jgi:acetoin utilization deacetylase AcuC-like enzyme